MIKDIVLYRDFGYHYPTNKYEYHFKVLEDDGREYVEQVLVSPEIASVAIAFAVLVVRRYENCEYRFVLKQLYIANNILIKNKITFVSFKDLVDFQWKCLFWLKIDNFSFNEKSKCDLLELKNNLIVFE